VNVEEDEDDDDSDNIENTNNHELPADGKLERIEFEKPNEEKNPTTEMDMDESSTDSRTAERYSELAYKVYQIYIII
jgi:hypothetical protein